jgi:hypothetical protein
MRKNTSETLHAWRAGRPYGRAGDSVWTDGESVYSYDTCIVAPAVTVPLEIDGGTYTVERFPLNVTEYSRTTSEKQRGAVAFMGPGVFVEVDNLYRGILPEHLAHHARERHAAK